MPYVISKTFRFAAAHHLPQLPEDHKCRRVHGHNYEATIYLTAARLTKGMVQDYADLDTIGDWLRTVFDHRDLNDALDEPTAENLARAIYEAHHLNFPEMTGVVVHETPGTSASYYP